MTQTSGGSTERSAEKSMVHPVYLDTQMLFNFLGHVDDGVALVKHLSEQETTSLDKGSSRETKLRGALSGLFALAPLSASIDHAAATSERTSQARVREVTAARTYTEAALLNLLLEQLEAYPVMSVRDLASVAEGDLVRVTGTIVANPLQQLLDFYGRILPYLHRPARTWLQAVGSFLAGGTVEDAPDHLPIRQIRAAIKGQDLSELKTLALIREELEDCPIEDLLMVVGARARRNVVRRSEQHRYSAEPPTSTQPMRRRPWYSRAARVFAQGVYNRAKESGDRPAPSPTEPIASPAEPSLEPEGDFSVVLTVARGYMTRQAEEYLLGGRFTAIGKVTYALRTPRDHINLARRATVGVLGRNASEELLRAFGVDELRKKRARVTVSGPALQVLPLAIYV